jgi:uncharacterized protein
MAESNTLPIGPIALSERIETLDVLRGLALFGILAANMRAFNSPLAAYFDHSLMWQGAADRAAQIFIDIFISTKFITLFSFLFGIGFAVMMDRAAERGWVSRAFYLRRLAVLLLMGLCHTLFLWCGDILAPYALMGFVLFLFRRSSPRRILAWAVILYFWPLLLSGLTTALSLAGIHIPGPVPGTPQDLQRVVTVYSTGTYGQLFAEHLRENQFMLTGLVFFYPRFLGMFLLGLWVWRRGIVRNLAGHAQLLERCRRWGLLVGLTLNVLWAALNAIYHPNPFGSQPVLFLINSLAALGVPALSLFYACTVALAFPRHSWLRAFAPLGRTALSNYLLQTLICTTLFYSWGFGLFGKVGPLWGLVPTVLIYTVQVRCSIAWAKRFAYGPMEWLWRSLTYARAQPMMRPEFQ